MMRLLECICTHPEVLLIGLMVAAICILIVSMYIIHVVLPTCR